VPSTSLVIMRSLSLTELAVLQITNDSQVRIRRGIRPHHAVLTESVFSSSGGGHSMSLPGMTRNLARNPVTSHALLSTPLALAQCSPSRRTGVRRTLRPPATIQDWPQDRDRTAGTRRSPG
jgi:hypothetical protein